MPLALEASPERRRNDRFPLDAPARLYSRASMWESKIEDISLRGLLIERPIGWHGELGDRHRVELRLPGSIFVSMAVNVARLMTDRVGLELAHIDFDSFCHLKRLIELNVGDPTLLYRELFSLDGGS